MLESIKYDLVFDNYLDNKFIHIFDLTLDHLDFQCYCQKYELCFEHQPSAQRGKVGRTQGNKIWILLFDVYQLLMIAFLQHILFSIPKGWK